MKKIAFVFTFFLLFTVCAVYAQQPAVIIYSPKTIRFGVQASPTWSWVRTDDKSLEGLGTNWGLKLGAVGEFYFAPNYAIATGIGFAFNQGGRIQNGYAKGEFWPNSQLALPLQSLPTYAKLHYRLNYIEIPVSLKLRGGSNENSPVKYFVELPTLTLSILTKSVGDITGYTGLPAGSADQANDIKLVREVHPLALSLGLSAGIEYELAANANLMVGLGYQQMFTDFTTDNGKLYTSTATSPASDNSKATIRSLVLKVGIFF
jgi:hypothetical protein